MLLILSEIKSCNETVLFHKIIQYTFSIFWNLCMWYLNFFLYESLFWLRVRFLFCGAVEARLPILRVLYQLFRRGYSLHYKDFYWELWRIIVIWESMILILAYVSIFLKTFNDSCPKKGPKDSQPLRIMILIFLNECRYAQTPTPVHCDRERWMRGNCC